MLKRDILKNQKGMSMLEMLPILAIFVLLVNFAIGFFGIIHSGILNSIASRNYAFETFRNRSNLSYLRDIPGSDLDFTYTKTQLRLHGTSKEGGAFVWVVTQRALRLTDQFGIAAQDENLPAGNTARDQIDNSIRYGERLDFEGVNPVWIRVAYGICLNTTCGDR